MRIVLAGIIGRYPWGGVTWCSMMYLLGLRDLGHEVYYLEDTGECNYDPDMNSMATDPYYALRCIDESLRPFGLGESWCYVDYKGDHHGIEKKRFEEICRSADLFLVLSGGCWIWRDHYLSIPRKAFIDSDPAFTQMALANARENAKTDQKKSWYVDFISTYDKLFTFGSNIGSQRCTIPAGDFEWHHTWQPVSTALWQPTGPLPPRDIWTTVMTWKIKSFRDIGGNKDEEFLKVLDLAPDAEKRAGIKFELAINGPKDFLRERGWRCTDAFEVSRDPWRYHAYISSSRGEFSVAKHTYVETRSGWFSDRTECYLAAGRPAVVQDTGFSEHLPTGEGLHCWNSADDALEAFCNVEADYAKHSRKAQEIAREHFASDHVLKKLLDRLS